MKEQIELIIKTQLIMGRVDTNNVDIITTNIMNSISPYLTDTILSIEDLREIDEWVQESKIDEVD